MAHNEISIPFSKSHIKKITLFFLPVLFVLSGFLYLGNNFGNTDPEAIGSKKTAYTKPIARDMDAIMEEGVIRMVTRFNSSIYFIHFGEPKGFEYEFARAFAGQKVYA